MDRACVRGELDIIRERKAMKIKIDFGAPFIPEKDILSVTANDIYDQYLESTVYDQFNIFFVLLTTFHMCEDKGKNVSAAHVAYLASYYLFLPLTPPGSMELALHYAKKAMALDPSDFYAQWIEAVLEGN
jgi:hypothetical protein